MGAAFPTGPPTLPIELIIGGSAAVVVILVVMLAYDRRIRSRLSRDRSARAR